MNPYQTSLAEQLPAVPAPVPARRVFLGGYLWTVIAGVLFGIVAGPLGMGFGFFLAALVGMVTFPLAAGLAQVSGGRFSPVALAAMAGAATGLGAALLLILGLGTPQGITLPNLIMACQFGLIPMVLGGLGGGFGAWARVPRRPA